MAGFPGSMSGKMITRLHATLVRFEGRKAVLALDDGQELRFSRDELGGVQGEEFVLEALPAGEAALKRDDLARALLNQILQN